MADEITYAGSGDLRLTALLSREVMELLYDPTDLRGVCTFVPHELLGSSVVQVPQIDVDYAMTAPGETTAITNTAFVDASFNLTVARYALMFSLTDMMMMTDPGGSVDVAKLAQIVAGASGLTFTDLITALFGSLSNSVGGGAGVDMSVDYLYDGIYQLQDTNNSPPFTSVLKPNSFNEFQNSLRGETGPNQWIPASAEALMAKGPGYAGNWQGVDIYKCDSVATAAGVNQNAMFSKGCFAYSEGPIAKLQRGMSPAMQGVIPADARVLATVTWDDTQAEARVVGNYYPAVAEAEDDRGVLINSDD